MEKVRRFFREEEGISAVEYALIAVGIALAILTVVGTVGDNLKAVFTKIANALAGNTTAG